MGWVEHFHEDHMSVMLLLAKLEGNLREVRHLGQIREGILLECQEFLEIVEKVIRPHFLREEEHIYPAVARTGAEGQQFVDTMLFEHRQLYTAFEKFGAAVRGQSPEQLLTAGEEILRFLKEHIIKEEKQVPSLLKQ